MGDRQHLDEWDNSTTGTVLFILTNAVPLFRVAETLTGACQVLTPVISGQSAGHSALAQILDSVRGQWALRHHLLMLDGAYYRCYAEELMIWRGAEARRDGDGHRWKPTLPNLALKDTCSK